MSCEKCNDDGGVLVNPDWPMGDCGDRVWHPCDCGAPPQKAKLWYAHLRQYNHARFGTRYDR